MIWAFEVRILPLGSRRNKRTKQIIPLVRITHKTCVSLIDTDCQRQQPQGAARVGFGGAGTSCFSVAIGVSAYLGCKEDKVD
jgi:hypothetical protein